MDEVNQTPAAVGDSGYNEERQSETAATILQATRLPQHLLLLSFDPFQSVN
jgi:hypothetical protein